MAEKRTLENPTGARSPAIARNAVSFGACDLGDRDPPAHKAATVGQSAVPSDSIRIRGVVKQISEYPPPDRQDGYYDVVIILFLLTHFIFVDKTYNILTIVIAKLRCITPTQTHTYHLIRNYI